MLTVVLVLIVVVRTVVLALVRAVVMVQTVVLALVLAVVLAARHDHNSWHTHAAHTPEDEASVYVQAAGILVVIKLGQEQVGKNPDRPVQRCAGGRGAWGCGVMV